MKKVSEVVDVIVIGGGPAGMIAAGTAAKAGARVILFEKNNRLGVKLLMTGHGRCNVTNNIPTRDFIEKIGHNGKFLHAAMNVFNSTSLMNFCQEQGLDLKTENNNRVFPVSNKATDVLGMLERYMLANGVDIRLNSEIVKFNMHDKSITSVQLINGKVYQAKKFIVTTGGLSYPATGSTGDGHAWAKSLGHSVLPGRPGLTAINLQNDYAEELEGVSLQDVAAKINLNDRLVFQSRGDLIFTATGISGPLAHDLSLSFANDIKKSSIVLDLYPELSVEGLNVQLQEAFHQDGSKQIKNGLLRFLEPKLVSVVLGMTSINNLKLQNAILRAERQKIVQVMKNLAFEMESLSGFDKANVTVGGVDVREIDPKTMRSKLIYNLYFAGEVLDLAGPTGGFNLQIAWSTGFVAGSN